MIFPVWYFTDELEQAVGPYRTKEDAEDAQVLYAKYLGCVDFNASDIKRLKELTAFSQEFGK